MSVQNEQVPVMTVARFFRPGECFHIQMSTEFPDYMGIPHSHEYIEIVYVISGTAVHWLQDASYPVKRGDLCIVNVNTVHMFCPDPASAEPLVVYDLMVTPEFFDQSLAGGRTLEDLGGSYLFRSLPKGQGADTGFGVSENLYSKFSELFSRMYDEYHRRAIGYTEIIRAYLLQVVITAIRMNTETETRGGAFSREKLVKRVMDHMEACFQQPITLRELADTVHLSPDYLGRIFRETTGQTVSTYLQKLRLHKACQLLVTTRRTVADIASACGFGDAKNFYCIFKKHLGMPPGSYRQRFAEHPQSE